MVRSFPPIATRRARVLILGSMPGVASLAAGQYYAHPQNLFWPIVGGALGVDPAWAYARRVRALNAAGVAVWDVLASCVRAGSLDSEIDPRSIVANDFAVFFARYTGIRRVLFNGSMAAQCFKRHVAPGLPDRAALEFIRLPSTSPANASISVATKRAAWRAALDYR